MKPDIKHQEKLVREWNQKHPVGTRVIVTKDDVTELDTITVNEATMLGGHTAVAWLKDLGGCYNVGSRGRESPGPFRARMNRTPWNRNTYPRKTVVETGF